MGSPSLHGLGKMRSCGEVNMLTDEWFRVAITLITDDSTRESILGQRPIMPLMLYSNPDFHGELRISR